MSSNCPIFLDDLQKMAKAIWNGEVLAESDKYEMLEGNIYFPPESVKKEYPHDSGNYYECPWKGHADYFNVKIADKINSDAAWSYPDPKPAARKIKEHVAFDGGKGITVDGIRQRQHLIKADFEVALELAYPV